MRPVYCVLGDAQGALRISNMHLDPHCTYLTDRVAGSKSQIVEVPEAALAFLGNYLRYCTRCMDRPEKMAQLNQIRQSLGLKNIKRERPESALLPRTIVNKKERSSL